MGRPALPYVIALWGRGRISQPSCMGDSAVTERSSTQPAAANGEDNRQAFWTGMRRLAERGMVDPNDLSPEEVSTVCRLVVLGLTRREDLQPTGQRSSQKS